MYPSLDSNQNDNLLFAPLMFRERIDDTYAFSHLTVVHASTNSATGVNVLQEGLEPPLLTEPDPKSGAATNYATGASCFVSKLIQSLVISVSFTKFKNLLRFRY